MLNLDFLILLELKRQGLHIGYLFLVLFISFNVYLHRNDGPFNPCKEVKVSPFSASPKFAGPVTIEKDGFSQNSSAPEKKKFKIRTRYKAADIVEIPASPLVLELRSLLLPLRHTSLLRLYYPECSSTGLSLRGPPLA
jgi:hypothetical protein